MAEKSDAAEVCDATKAPVRVYSRVHTASPTAHKNALHAAGRRHNLFVVSVVSAGILLAVMILNACRTPRGNEWATARQSGYSSGIGRSFRHWMRDGKHFYESRRGERGYGGQFFPWIEIYGFRVNR